MKTKIFMMGIVALLISVSAFAQDIIITKDAKKIEAKILEVSKSEIKYKDFDNLEGPTFILEVEEINSITYQNGKVVLYNQKQQETSQVEVTEMDETQLSSTIATSNVAEANEYNVEILLISGQIIKAKLMETANTYVAYTYNGKYFTMPADKVEKVTDLRNGKVTEYHGNTLDANIKQTNVSNQPSYQEKGSRIYRDGNHYLHNEVYISGKEVERILERENYAAYQQWKKAEGMQIGGAVCTGLGSGLVTGGLFFLIGQNYKACIGIELSALVPLGIGLGLTLGASAQYNKAIDLYNSKYDHAAVQLKWHVSPTNVGFAIAF